MHRLSSSSFLNGFLYLILHASSSARRLLSYFSNLLFWEKKIWAINELELLLREVEIGFACSYSASKSAIFETNFSCLICDLLTTEI